jgi:CheY-like chemotaxis protein
VIDFEPTEDVRVLLRSEFYVAGEKIVSYALELSETSVFVVTDHLPAIGTTVSLGLSFPGLLASIDLEARVTGQRVSMAPGDPSGVELEFEYADPESLDEIRLLLDQLAKTPKDSKWHRPYSVLLVEDNAFIRDMFAYGIARYFGARQDTVRFEHAEDAKTAWEKLSHDLYDLVIVDYYLPAEDGAALISRVRKCHRLARVPIVAISVGGRDARDATISAGADMFLDKPVVMRDLFTTLERLAGHGAHA